MADQVLLMEARLQNFVSKELQAISKQVGDLGAKQDRMAKQSASQFDKMMKSANMLRQGWFQAAAAAAALGFAVRNLSKDYLGFEHRLAEVNTLIGMSGRDIARYGAEVIGMTRQIPQSAEQLTAALYDIVSAGVAVEQSTGVLELSAKAAIAGVTDTKTAAHAGLAVINAYGMSIDDLDEVYDTLFQTVKLGVTTFPQLSEAIGVALPIARSAGVSYKEVASSIATMTKAGIDTTRATTYMRSSINALAAPAKEAKEAMEKMGITWNGWIPTLRQIAKLGLGFDQMKLLIPDQRAVTGLLSLSQNIETLESTMNAMNNSKGAMKSAYDIMMNSPTNQIKLLGNAFTEVKMAVASAFGPTALALMKDFAKQLQIIVGYSKGWNTETISLYRTITETLPKMGDEQERLNWLTQEHVKILAKLAEADKNYAVDIILSRSKKGTDAKRAQLKSREELLSAAIDRLKNKAPKVIPTILDPETTTATPSVSDKTKKTVAEMREQFNLILKMRKEIEDVGGAEFADTLTFVPNEDKLKTMEAEYANHLQVIRNGADNHRQFMEKIADEQIKQEEKQSAAAKKTAQETIAYQQMIRDVKVGLAENATYTALRLGELAIQGSRKNAKQQKAMMIGMAIAQAAVSTVFAVEKAWSSSKSWQEGLVKGLASGAVITGQTAGSIAAIRAQRFAQGGVVGGGGGVDSRLIAASPREMVLTEDDQANLLRQIRKPSSVDASSITLNLSVGSGASIDSISVESLKNAIIPALRQLTRSGQIK